MKLEEYVSLNIQMCTEELYASKNGINCMLFSIVQYNTTHGFTKQTALFVSVLFNKIRMYIAAMAAATATGAEAIHHRCIRINIVQILCL